MAHFFTGFSNINETVAVLDVDGVVLDFSGGFEKVGSCVLGRDLKKVSSAYSLAPRFGLTSDEFKRVWSAMDDHEHGWANIPLLPGAVEAVTRLRSMGLSIHLSTGIDPAKAETRLGNLDRHGILVDSIDCVGVGAQSKIASLLKHRPLMFVDDLLSMHQEADFVPYRVWVDHGDTQGGHVVNESIIRTTSLLAWVNQFERLHGVVPLAPPAPVARRRIAL